MRTRAASIALGSVLAGVTGCSLLLATSDLRSGDAGSDAAAADAAQDTSLDAGDAGIARDAADAGPFCFTQDAAFCDDFDDYDAGVFFRWSGKNVSDGSTLDLGMGASPPFSLRATTPASGGAGTAVARVYAPVGVGAVTRVRVAYDVAVDTYDSTTGSGLTLMSLKIVAAGVGELYQRLYLSDLGGRLSISAYKTDAGTTYNSFGANVPFPPATWKHVEMALDLGTNPPSVGLVVDGKDYVNDAGLGVAFPPGTAQILAPMDYVSLPSPGWSVRVDNVVVWIQ